MYSGSHCVAQCETGETRVEVVSTPAVPFSNGDLSIVLTYCMPVCYYYQGSFTHLYRYHPCI